MSVTFGEYEIYPRVYFLSDGTVFLREFSQKPCDEKEIAVFNSLMQNQIALIKLNIVLPNGSRVLDLGWDVIVSL